MLKTKKDFKYSQNPDSTNAAEYKISPNDIIEFSLYSNDGFKLVDLTSLNSNTQNILRVQEGTQYLVEAAGEVKLPVLGKIKITGYTLRDAQSLLEEKYAAYYIRPYVMIRVINKRVIIFPGSAGDAKVIPLFNNNTTLIEGIALAGGLADDGKAKMIKLIRENKGSHDVYLIDLSVIEGIKQGSMVLQANDIIYVEPRKKYATRFFQEAAPIISILTSGFILYSYSRIITR
ncbi:MAG TPA: polysaccharide biosynthesis/export family protein [Bacteroidia bacterium]|nr:polysaccharide biosynthesis/export family protein [Bacteroidia bacterium]